jgi:hypothetical protein
MGSSKSIKEKILKENFQTNFLENMKSNNILENMKNMKKYEKQQA